MTSVGLTNGSCSPLYLNGKKEEIERFLQNEIPGAQKLKDDLKGVPIYEVSLPLDILLLLFDENYSSAANPFDELE